MLTGTLVVPGRRELSEQRASFQRGVLAATGRHRLLRHARPTYSGAWPTPGPTASSWLPARVAIATPGTHRARDWSSTSRLSTPSRSNRGCSFATVGAGAQLVDVYSQLGSSGLLLPGGSCPTVGIAGLALGGGIGVFGRAYGMTCDNIASLSIVTADGSLRQCSPTSDSDLYWASQGRRRWQFRHRDVVHLHRPSHPQP